MPIQGGTSCHRVCTQKEETGVSGDGDYYPSEDEEDMEAVGIITIEDVLEVTFLVAIIA